MTLVTAVYGYDLTDKYEEHALMEQEFLESVIGMKPGGRRLLMVPPVFAYGDRGVDDVIAPNSGLILLVDLLAANPD